MAPRIIQERCEVAEWESRQLHLIAFNGFAALGGEDTLGIGPLAHQPPRQQQRRNQLRNVKDSGGT